MNIYDSKTWISDLDEELANIGQLDELEGSAVLITGATGLICSSLVDLLIRYNESHLNHIHIIAAGRSRERFSERFFPYSQKDYLQFMSYDASDPACRRIPAADYIIHGASNASPGKIMKEPVETMLSNIMGLKVLLDSARENGTKKIVFISSSEVYGQNKENRPITECDHGSVDLLNPRNSYSVGKMAAETLCASYAAEYGLAYNIVRPGHIYGPTAGMTDNRVSSLWPYDVAKGSDITMKSDGSQIRSYCYCADCASAILKVLVSAECGKAYNISNPASIISIKEMADILVKAAGVRLVMDVPTDEERKGFNPMTNSSLDSERLLALGWKGIFDAERGFAHTISIIKECMHL